MTSPTSSSISSSSSRGKGQSLYRCKLRNMLTGSQMDRTFREVDTFKPADTEEKTMQYLYKESDAYHFMDNENYEQLALTEAQVGDAKNFLIENMECKILFFRDRPIDITLPNFVDVVVTEAPPWIKGDTVSGNYKPVIGRDRLQGERASFVEQGEKIRIDTRTGVLSYPSKGMSTDWTFEAKRQALEMRACVLHALRSFFLSQDYLEVETPNRIPAPLPESHIDALPAGGWSLHPSPELCMKRMLAAGYERIFQICKCYRGASAAPCTCRSLPCWSGTMPVMIIFN